MPIKTDENYGYIGNYNSFNPVAGIGGESRAGSTGNFIVPTGGTKTICHSHPKGKRYGPMLSFGDADALTSGYPKYIVRDDVAGIFEMIDGQYQYRLLQGRIDNT